MPADEGFYRDQKKLHAIFLLSSLAMLGVTIWMLAADHVRPWKKHQREFLSIQQALANDKLRQAERELRYQTLAGLEEEKASLASERARLVGADPELAQLAGELAKKRLELENQQREIRFQRAHRQERASDFDLAVRDRGQTDEKGMPRRAVRLDQQRDKTRESLAQFDELIAAMDKKEEQLKAEIAGREEEVKAREGKSAEIKEIDQRLVQLGEEIKKLDAPEREFEDTQFTTAKMFRALPIIDGFASPLKVKQTFHEDLGLDYNFKKATRFDRCMTCHLGIDEPGYDAKWITEPYRSHPHLDLFVGSQSKHPMVEFGCTICHQGQGSATSFDWASHTPADQHQMGKWNEEHGWFFNHFHELPMLPARFVESSCLKCHHDPYEIPQAQKLLLGYETVRTYGCFGCHEIQGYKEGRSVGPHLRLAQKNESPEEQVRSLRKVGPALDHVGDKLGAEFVERWLRNPPAFRPNTRMPQFFHQLDVDSEEWPSPEGEFADPHSLAELGWTEIHAISKYLFTKSTRSSMPTVVVDVGGAVARVRQARDQLAVTKEDRAKAQHELAQAEAPVLRGKNLFLTKGCLACHFHKDFEAEWERMRKEGEFDVSLAPRFGPDLSDLAAKFTTSSQMQWVAQWILDPASYNPVTYMPNVQLGDEKAEFGSAQQQAADLATFLLSVPGGWQQQVRVPPLDESALHDLVLHFQSQGAARTKAIEATEALSTDEKLVYLGEKTIARLGCFGCHSIPGEKDGKRIFDDMKPIGVPLMDPSQAWGRKHPSQLAFENVPDYIRQQGAEQAGHRSEAIRLADQQSKLMSLVPRVEGDDLAPLVQWVVGPQGEKPGPKAVDLIRDGQERLEDELVEYLKEHPAATRQLGASSRLAAKAAHEAYRILNRLTESVRELEEAQKAAQKADESQRASAQSRQRAAQAALRAAADGLAELPKRQRALELALRSAADALGYYANNDYFLWAIEHHQREGFLMQKLREPRSYDYKKIRTWVDRARMPQFELSNEQREAIATFVLGLVGDEVEPERVYRPDPHRRAEIRGRGLLDQYNCVACHVVDPAEYRFVPSPDMAYLAEDAKKALEDEYTFDHSAWKAPPTDGPELALRGLYDGEDDPFEVADPKTYVQLWYAASMKGQSIPAGTRVPVPQSILAKGSVTPAHGGLFAQTLVEHFVQTAPVVDASTRGKSWWKAPPPLIREGEKVQTEWLYRFLRDPVAIRPTVVLRMPRFNFRQGDVEALANFFAAHDDAPYPYLDVPEAQTSYVREETRRYHEEIKKYLARQGLSAEQKTRAERSAQDAGAYLGDAFRLVTDQQFCVKCHPVGGFKPQGTGKPAAPGQPEAVEGPILARAPQRLRPEWMMLWITNPPRLVPFTGMPVNFPKNQPPTPQTEDLVKGTNLDRARAARDVLVNYGHVVDQLLAEQRAAASPAASAQAPTSEGRTP